ncbi:MAG: hypothetical protein QM802_02020 [Agriterribacter sp.]
MIEMTIETLELRIQAVEQSYERQLNLSGKSGYDHSLTLALKKDLDFLYQQRNSLTDHTAVQQD